MGISARWHPNFPGEMKTPLIDKIFTVSSSDSFRLLCLEVFNFQYINNDIYREYVSRLGIDPSSVKFPEDIPFLPVELFKSHKIITGNDPVQAVFESSGSTGKNISRHYVTDLSLYEKSFKSGFRIFYGDPGDYFIAALLPSYIERGNSSLIYMADKLIRESADSRSGFFRGSPESLISVIREVTAENRKAILIGVSFALMDLAEEYSPDLNGTIVIETGGMKGRRKELTREEMHGYLKTRLNLSEIHSEYGMTELLSQAWSKGGGIFYAPPWMKIYLREINDPLAIIKDIGITGGINIIDLANINSCSFIATNDLGRFSNDGGFEVIGRFDNSDTRGCNLLIE